MILTPEELEHYPERYSNQRLRRGLKRFGDVFS